MNAGGVRLPLDLSDMLHLVAAGLIKAFPLWNVAVGGALVERSIDKLELARSPRASGLTSS
jgi:hypothetical protein